MEVWPQDPTFLEDMDTIHKLSSSERKRILNCEKSEDEVDDEFLCNDTDICPDTCKELNGNDSEADLDKDVYIDDEIYNNMHDELLSL